MRILIAGGAGFVGSHLAARLLAEGHDVLVVDNFLTGSHDNVRRLLAGPGAERLELLDHDVCRPFHAGPPLDAVFNLASPASPVDYHRWPLETLQVGADGTRNLLELARRAEARFLLASTSEVYGDPEIHPQPESYWGHVNPVGPRSVYDEAKRYSEALASAYARHIGTTVRIARIFNTYGPGMRLFDGRVIPSFVAQALKGEPIAVHGDGSQTRSYCYVDDLVSGLMRLMWSDVEGPVNLGNPEEYTVLETARIILRLTGSRSAVTHLPLPTDDPRMRRPDIERATSELAWAPRTRFVDGLARTIADIRERLAAGHSPELATRPSGNGAVPHLHPRAVGPAFGGEPDTGHARSA